MSAPYLLRGAAPTDQPAPGSDYARLRGCVCNQIDNFFGRGQGDTPRTAVFVMRSDCPLHGEAPTGIPADGVHCAHCEAPVQLTCTNGHAGDIAAPAPRERIRGRVPKDAPEPKPNTPPRTCARCRQPIEVASGRPPKICEACLTPEERARRIATREAMRAKAAAKKAGVS